MIAPTRSADPRPASALDGLVEFRVDADAQPGGGARPGAAADRPAPQTHGRGR